MNYAEFFNQCFMDEFYEVEQFNYIFELLRDIDKVGEMPIRVLEIGAGTGRCLEYYCKYKNVHVDLVEPDKFMRNILIENCQNSNVSTVIHDAYSYNIKIADATFDLIVVPFVGISEMGPLHSTFAEIKRLLKPNGIVYLNVFNTDHVLQRHSHHIASAVVFKDSFSATIDTFRAPHLGKFGFEINIDINHQNKGNDRFTIQQWSPNHDLFMKIFNLFDFDTIKIFGLFGIGQLDLDKDRFATYILKNNLEKERQIVELFYDNMSEKYESICKGKHYKVPQWLIQRIEMTLPCGLFPKWLDLGCGTGIVGDILNQLNVQPSFLCGFDLSDQMLKECRKKNTYDALGKCDLNKGIFEPKESIFDVVSALGVLEFVDDLQLVLGQIHRLLKKEGILFITVECLESNENKPNYFNYNNGKIMRKRYSQGEIREILHSIGFDIIDINESEAYLSPSLGININYLMITARKLFI